MKEDIYDQEMNKEVEKYNLKRIFGGRELTVPLALLGTKFKEKYWRKSIKPKIKRRCLYCNKKFFVTYKNRFYCSEECKKKGHIEWLKNNSEKIKKHQKKYYQKNKEKIKIKRRGYMRNYMRKYAQKE